jgi:hypothetical protein
MFERLTLWWRGERKCERCPKTFRREEGTLCGVHAWEAYEGRRAAQGEIGRPVAQETAPAPERSTVGDILWFSSRR